MKHFFTCLFVLIFTASNLIAANNPSPRKNSNNEKSSKSISLSGTIEDAENSEKLVCATIEIEKLGLKVFSDIEGNFQINDLKSGDFTLKISYISYQEIQINAAELSENKTLNIKLKPL